MLCNECHGHLGKQAAEGLFVSVDSDNSETARIRPQKEKANRNVKGFVTVFSSLLMLFPLSPLVVFPLSIVSASHPPHRHFFLFSIFKLSNSEI